MLAVKGLGGYHLAADARSEQATAALRARKHREDKPFAVMAAGLDRARRLCAVDDVAADLLTSRRRPIVLLPTAAQAREVAAAVAPGNRHLGVMLPYTPLHHLLLAQSGEPIVLTSGNVSDEPIAYQDDDALVAAEGHRGRLPDPRPADPHQDRRFGRAPVPRPGRRCCAGRAGTRPSRCASRPRFAAPVLACGAELKSTFCLAKDDRAFVSQHIGDLENAETLRSFTEGIEHFAALFEIRLEVIAHDLHPDYLSTKYALDRADGRRRRGPARAGRRAAPPRAHRVLPGRQRGRWTGERVIGVAFDGTGYGTDGTIWGGEFLIAGLAGFARAGHLAPVPMPGGAAAIRQPWRMAAAYLDAAFPGGPDEPARRRIAERGALGERGRDGQARHQRAADLERGPAVRRGGGAARGAGQRELRRSGRDRARAAGRPGRDAAPTGPRSSGARCCRWPAPTWSARPPSDLAAGVAREKIAARFHNGTAGLIADCCGLLRERTGLGTVALSGGVFQNLLLLHNVVGLLESDGFTVLTHSRVPCNDGGISLGQAVVAAARTSPDGPGASF